MKKTIFAAMAMAVVGMHAQTSRAGDREWATVGKVLTGMAAVTVIAKAIDCPPAYASVSYGYATPGCSVSYAVSTPPPCPPPRVVCAPPPVIYVPAPVVVRHPASYTPRPVCYAPVYQASRNHPGRGNAYGHEKEHGRGYR